MLTGVIRRSLRRPRLTAAASAVLFLFGAWYVRDTPVEIFPALAPAQTIVQTDAAGLAADQVEQLVTRPIENALLGAPGVASVRSDSIQGLSVVRLGFARGGDAGRIRQSVTERLAQVNGALPPTSRAPRIAPLASTTGDVLQVGFTSDTLNPMQLRNTVLYLVRPRLLAAQGVANVAVYGGQTRRIEIRARPGDLSDSDLGFEDVLNAVQRASSVAGAGFMDTPSQRVVIDPRGQALTADDVAAGQIQVVGNAPVRISDVADVAEAPAPAFGDALIMGKPGVLLSVEGQYGAQSLATSRAVEQALANLRPALAREGVAVTDLDRPADFITDMVRRLGADLLIGAAMILVILLVVLRDPRAVLVSFVGIPLALLAALVAIKALGLTLNAMTLGGLFVALGTVIDDAVIDTESIVSRLCDAEGRHASRSLAVLEAVLEVRTPVIYATLLIDVALLPMLFLGGVFGAFLAPLALTVVVASLASLVVSVWLTPAIALLLLPHLKPAQQPRPPGPLKAGYLQWIERRCAAPGLALAALAVAAIAAVAMLALFQREALPSFRDDHLVVDARMPPATSLEVMQRVGAGLAKAALTIPGAQHVAERIGRDPTDFSAAGPEQGDLELGLDPGLGASGQARAEQRLRTVLASYPDVTTAVRRRLDAQQTGAEDRAPFSVSVYGDNLDAVDQAAQGIAAGLRALSNAGEVTVSTSPLAPAVRIDLNFKRLAIYGLSAADVLDTVQAAFQGKTVAQIYEDGRPVDLAVTGPQSIRHDPEAIGRLLLRSSSGVSVPLRGVANVFLTDSRSRIQHDAGQRLETVTANPPAATAGHFEHEAGRYLDGRISLPPGVFIVRRSAAAAASADRRALLINGLVAALAMLGLLLIIFRDGRATILILASTAFAFVGGALAVALTGGVLSLGSLAGFIALFGLSTRNAIILVSRPHALIATRKTPWTLQTIQEAASQRAAPILLTALLAAVAVLPLAVGGGGAAGAILGPMAVVIMGGALSGAILTVLFQPALIYAYQRPSHRSSGGAAEA